MEIQHCKHESWSDTESTSNTRVGYSGPLSGPILVNNKKNSSKKSARFKDDDEYDEITLDIRHNSVSVQNTKEGDPETAMQVSQELKQMTSTQAPFVKVDMNKSGSARALQGLKFMTKNVASKGWSAIEKQFDELSVDGSLPKTLFGQCIGMKDSKEFTGELFEAWPRRRGITSSGINKAELREFWDQITDQSFDARLQTFFDMVDKNADGRITEEEIKEIITSASANKPSKIQECAEEYAALIMEELDEDNLGYIEIYKLEILLLQDPSQSTNKKLLPTKERNCIKSWGRGLPYFLDNWKRIWVLALWVSIWAGLFIWKFIQYKNLAVFDVMGYCVNTAEGAAETTKFNMALILLLVCRNTITWLRSRTKLGVIVPFDDNINFHKVVALGIAIGAGLHAVAHLACDYPRLLHATDDEYEPMKPFFGDERPNNYWLLLKGTEGWTGVAMLVLMAIAYILAQPWFRRNWLNLPKPINKFTGFNAFWYSHHLFVIVYALFIVHGYFLYLSKKWYKKTTWMYIAVPMLLYACERLIRIFRSGYKSVKILKVVLYPGNLLFLHMSKPQGFKYNSGQYIFVNCAAVSPFQWHPFSITSAPGDDYLSIHIRSLGDWTSQLKVLFAEVCQPPVNQSGLLRADIVKGENKPKLPKLLIDGPYGAPAQDYKKYDVLLLVGLGIGATPLISIVKDVLNNIKQQKEIDEGIEAGVKNKKKPFACKRAYFYWAAREQGSFEWFKGVMNEVAKYDRDRVIELHHYCTSLYEEKGSRSALITMLQSLHHDKSGVDIVSGTGVMAHFARPNWNKVFKHVADDNTDQTVGVFYCGAPVLTGELRKLALDFSRKTSTKFDFHKENF